MASIKLNKDSYVNHLRRGYFMGEKLGDSLLDHRVVNFVSINDKVLDRFLDNSVSWYLYFYICFRSKDTGSGVYISKVVMQDIGSRIFRSYACVRNGLLYLVDSGMVLRSGSVYRLNSEYIYSKKG